MLDLNIDIAEQEVQAAINAASHIPADESAEPANLQQDQSGGRANSDAGPVLRSLPLTKVEDLADTNLAQKISQFTGVGLVTISGGEKPAVRVQANPTSLASYGLSLEDLRTALARRTLTKPRAILTGRAGLYDWRERSTLIERRLQAADHRVPQWRARYDSAMLPP